MKAKRWLLAVLTVLLVVSVFASVVACTKPEEEKPLTEGPETGVYYYDDFGSEYVIALNGGNKASFLVKNANKSGTYTLDGTKLTLTFADETIEGTLSDGKLTVNYLNSEMEFVLKVNYTVTFDSCGGSAVANVTVVNGKTISAPAAPEYAGHTFIGWYKDEAHAVPFLFGAEAVTDNITLYAYWVEEVPGASEYTVDFNLGYDGETIAAQSTVGGALVTLPTPVSRTNFTFEGWFVSQSDNAEKLSYKYEIGTAITENTTLFALWTATDNGGKLAAPAASLTASGLTWNAVSGATGYIVTIDDGNEIRLDASVTNYAFDAALTAGEHKATVIATGATSAQNSDEAVRYFAANALSRVSLFTVIDDFVVFKGVDNATNYFITVECGNKAHNHANIALGKSTSYSFANCAMQEGGILFTVTATADGYLSSTSRTFVYERKLAAIDGLHFDEATETITWNVVADAQSYIVSVSCGNASHSHTTDIGNVTSYSLKSCAPKDGGITFAVYPVTDGYVSPVAATYTYNKTAPATPDNLKLVGSTLSWNGTEGATYEVNVNGKVYETSETTCDLSSLLGSAEISVRATLNGAKSLWSDTKTIGYFVKPDGLTYADGKLTWNEVFGAASYEVSVNGGEAISTEAAEATVALTKAGNNTLAVRLVPQTGDKTDWTTLVVYAYEITLNVNGGSAIDNNTLYLAQGDALTLPQTTRTEYDFAGWYNAKSGAAGNAKLYTDGIFRNATNLELYASWTGKTFTVNYNLNAEEGEATIASPTGSVVYASADFNLDVPSREGYVFDGWFTGSDLATRLTDNLGHAVTAWTLTGEDGAAIEVYAGWKQVLTFTAQPDGNYYVQAGPDIDSVTEVTVPQTYKGQKVAAIYEGAFKNCRNLEVINFYDTVETVGVTTDVANGPFAGCENLQAVNVIKSGVANPKYYSVDGALVENEEQTALKALVFVTTLSDGEFAVPEGVQRIPGRLFANAKFRKITIPASVEEIGENAFYNCRNLVSVQFLNADADTSETVKALQIGDYAFRMCESLREINLPKRTGEINSVEKVFDRCSALISITVASGNANYASVDGMLTNAAGNTVLYCPYGIGGAVVLSDSIKAIGESAFAARPLITKITIRETVENIAANAFSGMSNLRIVEFAGSPLGVGTQVGDYAFANCARLESVQFAAQSKVTSIGAYAFANDKGIGSIVLPKSLTSLADYAFSGCSGMRSVTLCAGGNSALGSYVFEGCNLLDTINLSESVTSIALNAFAGCEKLTTINVDENNVVYASKDGVLYNKAMTQLVYCSPRNKITSIPDTVTEICDSAFASTTITSVTIGKNVTKIGANAFYGAAALTTLTFEDGRTAELTIGNNAFELCSALTAATLPETTKSIGAYAFAKSGIATLSVPATVTEIGAHAFADCTVLGSATISANIAELPESLFENCAKLAAVNIASDLTAIGANAFSGASALSSFNAQEGDNASKFNLPASLTTIGANAFAGTSVEAVEIPAAVTGIATGAFANSKLLALTFAAGNASLEIADGQSESEGAFAYTAISSLALPERLTKLGAYAFYRTNLTSLSFAGDKLTAIGAYAFSYAFGTKAAEGETIVVAIPEGITEIGAHAFDNGNITALTLPSTLATLGERAFASQSQLTSVAFASGKGASVDLAIGNYAFANDANLATITLSDSLSSIGTDAFVGCNALTAFRFAEGVSNSKGFETEENGGVLYAYDLSGGAKTIRSFYVPANYNFGETAFRIPDGVKTIPANAFYDSNITKIDLNEVETIGDNAFRGSKLTAITLSSNVKEIGNYAFYGTAIETLTIPTSVTAIGDYAFANIRATITVTVPATEEGGEDTTTTEVVNAPTSVTFEKLSNESNYLALTLGEGVFANAGLTSVELPKRLVSLGSSAFAGNTSLATLTFDGNRIQTSGGVTIDLTLGAGAFENTAITTATLPEGLTAIPEKLFGGRDSALTTVTIPSTVTTIAANAFNGNGNLATVTFTAGGTSALTIGDNAFTSAAITAIELPARLASIGNYAFRDCNALASVTFENGGANSLLETVGEYAFNTANSSVEEFSIVLPDSVKTIGKSAFEGSKLHTFRLPASLTSIYNEGYYFTFKNCSSLTTIDIGKSTATLNANVFGGLTAIEKVLADSDNTAYLSNNGVLFDKAQSTLIYYPAGKTDATYTLPDSVTAIGERAFSRENSEGKTDMNKSLTEITFGAGLTTIGNYAFCNMSTLAKVDFAANGALTTIGEYAFYGNGIGELTIPGSVTTLSAGAFGNNTKLQKLTFAEGSADLTIGDKAFEMMGSALTDIAGEDGLTTEVNIAPVVIPARVTTIGYNSFGSAYNATKRITDITFEQGSRLTAIGNSAFSNQGITSFVVPADVATIGDNAFMNTPLESITFNNVLATIGSMAFNNTTSLESVVIPASVTSIGSNAFNGSGITSVTFAGANDVALGNGVFSGADKLTSVTLPEGLTVLPESAFAGCSALTEITLPASLTEIGNSVFAKTYNKPATALTTITIPSSVTTIGDSAFSGITTLASIDFANANALTTIGASAFSGCTGITELTMPESLTTIGANAFSGLTNLTKVLFVNSALETIGSGAFANCTSLTDFELPALVKEFAADSFSGCSALELALSRYNTDFVMRDGIIYNRDTTAILYITPSKLVGKITIMDGVETIADGLFKGATELTEVVLPDSVTSIGANAFNGSGITSIKLPQYLKTIGASAFQNTKITAVEIPATTTFVGTSAFRGLSTLTSLTFEKGGTEALSFADYAFYGTAITELVIPARMRNYTSSENNSKYGYNQLPGIGAYCFAFCTSLKSISYETNVATEIPGVLSFGNFAFSGYKANSGKYPKVGTAMNIETIELPSFVGADSWAYSNYGTDATGYLKAFGYGCFAGNTKLTDFIFEKSDCEKLYTAAFVLSYCNSLKNIVLPENMTYMSNGEDRSPYLDPISTTTNYRGSGREMFYKVYNLESFTAGSANMTLFNYCDSAIKSIAVTSENGTISDRWYSFTNLKKVFIRNIASVSAANIESFAGKVYTDKTECPSGWDAETWNSLVEAGKLVPATTLAAFNAIAID